MSTATHTTHRTAVLHVGGLNYASEKGRVEHALCARPGVIAVEANPVADRHRHLRAGPDLAR